MRAWENILSVTAGKSTVSLYANSNDHSQPAHLRRLTMSFAVRSVHSGRAMDSANKDRVC